jgi:hypothetical protein
MSRPAKSKARSGVILRRHGIAAFLAGASLLWGAGFAQIEDGQGARPLGGIVAAVASEAESITTSERQRNSAAPRSAVDRAGYG